MCGAGAGNAPSPATSRVLNCSARPTTSAELEPVEVRLGTDQEEQVEAPRVRAVAKLDLGPAQLGRHAVDDAGHRPSGALVQEVLAVEGGDQVGVGDLEQCRDRGRGAEARIAMALANAGEIA